MAAEPSQGRLEPTQVRAMFDRIAGVYDPLNTVMSAGLHRRWRARAADLARVGPGSRVLDVATGTGDLAIELARRVSPGGEVVGSDFSEAMLARARTKAAAAAPERVTVRFEWADALELPYEDASFDAATVGFGARNFGALDRGLAEMARVVRPSGRVVVLELATPTRPPLSIFYRLWFDRLVPRLGRLTEWAGTLGSLARGSASGAHGSVRGAHRHASATHASVQGTQGSASGGPGSASSAAIADAYAYLPSSVKRFPTPVALAAEMEAAGLGEISYVLVAGGIVAIHVGAVR